VRYRHTAYVLRGLGSNTLSISATNDGIEPGDSRMVGLAVRADF
jgi:hypothetical protein